MPEDPADHRWVLDARQHPDLAPALLAGLNLNPEYPLEPLTWAQRLKRVFKLDLQSCEGGECRSHTFEPGAYMRGHGRHFGVAGHLQHRYRIHEGDDELAIYLLAHDYVTGQQQPDVGLCRECAVRKGRIAGAQNPIGTAIDAELGLHGGLDVDLGENAEALGFEGLGLIPPHLTECASAVCRLLADREPARALGQNLQGLVQSEFTGSQSAR